MTAHDLKALLVTAGFRGADDPELGRTVFSGACREEGCSGPIAVADDGSYAECGWCLADADVIAAGYAPSEATPGVGVVLRKLSDYEDKPISWLWKGWIPCGELSLLAGDGGLGKSTLAAHIAAYVTTGRFTGTTGTRNVLIALGEDDPGRVLRGRLRAAGADEERVRIVAWNGVGGELPLTLPDQFPHLISTMEELRPALVIVDPLTAYLNGSVDTHRDGGKGGMRAVLGPLSQVAQRTGAAVLCVVHLNKGNGPASQRLAGSAGIRNAARNVIGFAEHPDAQADGTDDGRRIIGHDKNNYGPLQGSLSAVIESVPALDEGGRPLVNGDGDAVTVSRIKVGGVSDVGYADAMRATAEGAEDRTAETEAVDLLLTELADGPVSVTDLKKAASSAGVAWRTVERAFKRLGVKSAKHGKHWVRFLPDELLGGVDEQPENSAYVEDFAPSNDSSPPSPPVQDYRGGDGGVDGVDDAPVPRWRTQRPGLRGGCKSPDTHATAPHPWGTGDYCPTCAPLPSDGKAA